MRPSVFVLGTRAQLVKVAPVLRLANDAGLRHTVWFTGQHNESIDDLLEDFGVDSTIVRTGKEKERSSILRLLTWLPGTLVSCYRYVHSMKTWNRKAPLVVVHGDTLSTWLGALAGRLGGGWVVHLESGLSSGKLTDPFPEELLRRLTFRFARYALCPNDEAFERMRKYHCKVVHTGENTLLDCVRYALAGRGDETPKPGTHYVASIHRFQNIYSRERLATIVEQLIAVSASGKVYFILHPPTRKRLESYGLYERLQATPDVILQARMPYTEFLALIGAARGVFSDGGSNQEELSYLGVPTVLFRERTERPDGIGANVVMYDAAMGSLSDYVNSGKLDALRRPSRLDDAATPSKTTVDALLSWAA